ncbi:MAG: Hpt domain-containing protein [Acidobacteriota bacterium]
MSKQILAHEPIERLREMGRVLGGDVPRRILQVYLGDAPQRLAALRQSLTAGDAAAVEQAAHALKGSSANLGAVTLADLCHEIERQSRDSPTAGTVEQLSAVEAEYARVEQAMRQLLTEF